VLQGTELQQFHSVTVIESSAIKNSQKMS